MALPINLYVKTKIKKRDEDFHQIRAKPPSKNSWLGLN